MGEHTMEWARERGDEAAVAGITADRAARARLAALPDDERRDFLSRYFATVHSCDPKDVPAL